VETVVCPLFSVPCFRAAPILLSAFDQLLGYMDARLLTQTQYKPFYDAIGLAWNEAAGSLELDVSGVVASLRTTYAADASAGTAKLLDFAANLKTMGDFGGQVLDKLRASGTPTGSGFGYLLAYAGQPLVQGGANTLDGAEGQKNARKGTVSISKAEWSRRRIPVTVAVNQKNHLQAA